MLTTDLVLIRGDTRTKKIRFLHKSTHAPLILEPGDVGKLCIFSKPDNIILEKSFNHADQDTDSGYIYINFVPSDTNTIEQDSRKRFVEYQYEIQLTFNGTSYFTPMLYGKCLVLLDVIRNVGDF